MWDLNCKESWVPKNWCFWTLVLEKTFESPWDCKEIQSVHPKGSQSWIFIGRTDAEAETPILWSPDMKNWFIWKNPDAGKNQRQEEKGMTEDEMVGMALLTQCTWVWVSSGSWWWTGKPVVLQSMGLQRVGLDWATELFPVCSHIPVVSVHIPKQHSLFCMLINRIALCFSDFLSFNIYACYSSTSFHGAAVPSFSLLKIFYSADMQTVQLCTLIKYMFL